MAHIKMPEPLYNISNKNINQWKIILKSIVTKEWFEQLYYIDSYTLFYLPIDVY